MKDIDDLIMMFEQSALELGDAEKLLMLLISRKRMLESKLKYAAETFDLLDDHTHPNIECDAAAAVCRELLPTE